MKVFTAVLFVGTFLVLIGMPEKILAQYRPHEVFDNCGTWCFNICAEPEAESGICRPVCRAGTFCEEGYIREYEDGPCILPSECPSNPRPREFRYGFLH